MIGNNFNPTLINTQTINSSRDGDVSKEAMFKLMDEQFNQFSTHKTLPGTPPYRRMYQSLHYALLDSGKLPELKSVWSRDGLSMPEQLDDIFDLINHCFDNERSIRSHMEVAFRTETLPVNLIKSMHEWLSTPMEACE